MKYSVKSILKNYFIYLFLIVLISFILIRFSGAGIIYSRHNIANLNLNKAFATTVVVKRKQLLANYANQMNLVFDQSKITNSPIRKNTDMIQSIYIGQYYRLKGDLSQAIKWFQNAATVQIETEQQVPAIVTGSNEILSNGNISIEEFEKLAAWKLDKSTETKLVVESNGNIVNIEYLNTKAYRDMIMYSYWLGSHAIELSRHSNLVIRMKGYHGSYMSIEVIVDGKRERILQYYTGQGIWEEISIPLEGKKLEALYLSFSEPSNVDDMPVRQVQLDWIRMVLK